MIPSPFSAVVVLLISLISSGLSTIPLATMYVYAAEGKVPGEFEPELLEGAFQVK